MNDNDNRLTLGIEAEAGFTLIELVVVMAIIAVLATLIIGAIKIARTTAAETEHMSDARTLQAGLEAYYARYKSYPDISTEPDGDNDYSDYSYPYVIGESGNNPQGLCPSATQVAFLSFNELRTFLTNQGMSVKFSTPDSNCFSNGGGYAEISPVAYPCLDICDSSTPSCISANPSPGRSVNYILVPFNNDGNACNNFLTRDAILGP